MVKNLRSAWLGLFQRSEIETTASGAQRRIAERYPTHTRVVLPDGQLMHVRNASLAVAKDLLAAQNAIERRMRAERESRLMREVSDAIADAELMR
jgi:hypothetical protein